MSLPKLLFMALAVFLLGFSVLKDALQERSVESTRMGPQSQARPFSALSAENLELLRFQSSTDTCTLELQEAGIFSLRYASVDSEAEDVVPYRRTRLKILLEGLRELALVDPLQGNLQADAEYGFGKQAPRLRIVFGTHSYELEFGALHAITGRRYLRLHPEGKVYLIEDDLLSTVVEAVNQLEDTRALAIEPDQVHAVSVRPSGGGRYRLEKSEAEWFLHTGVEKIPAERRLLERKLQHFAAISGPAISGLVLSSPLVALEFHLEEKTEQGEKTVRARIYKSDTPAAFVLENVGQGRFYRVVGGQYKDFVHGVLQFRSRTPFADLALNGKNALSAEQQAQLREMRLLSYLAQADPEAFSPLEKRVSLSQDVSDVVLELGAALSSDTAAKHGDAPRYLKIHGLAKQELIGVISGADATFLKQLP